jgi:hypothetical protein
LYINENLSNFAQVLIQDEKETKIITWPEKFNAVIYPLKLVISEGFVKILNKLGDNIKEFIDFFKHIFNDPN